MGDQSRAFVRQIQMRMSAIGMNRADLARKLKVSRPCVTRLLMEGNNMRVSTMAKVANAVGLEVHIKLAADSPSPGCRCCDRTTTEAEMIGRHGTLESFERSMHAAVPEWISMDQADAHVERYRLDLAYAAARHDGRIAVIGDGP